MSQKKRLKIVIIILSVLLGITLLTLSALEIYRHLSPKPTGLTTVSDNAIGSKPVTSGENDSNKDDNKNNKNELPDLELYNKNPGDNLPFKVSNMFPGDSVKKTFRVSVYYKDTITVRYRADIRQGYEKLAEVLQTRIVLKNTNKVLYEGLMRDMPQSLNHSLQTTEVTRTHLEYEISVWLDTSVGNDYQEKALIADFLWWVGETDNLAPAPETGESSYIRVWVTVAACSIFAIFLLLIVFRRKKEEEEK